MASPTIHGPYRTVSASKLVNTVADTLKNIKEEDGLTDAEIGGFLGKGTDQGAKYRTGLAEMPMTSFLRGCERWNGRFANAVMALIGMKLVPLAARPQSDRTFAVILSRLKLKVDEALENDQEIDDDELDAMRALLEEAGQAIDARRMRRPSLHAVGDAA